MRQIKGHRIFEDKCPNITDLVIDEVYKYGYYKKGLEYLKKINKPTVLDLGAYIGITPVYFSVPGSTVYAVEANPEIYQCLQRNINFYENIYPIHAAIGYKDDERMMMGKPDDLSMSLYQNDTATDIDRYSVPGISFDTLFHKYINTQINLMKIDIEGAEYELFLSEGFKKLADRVDYIIGEAHEYPLQHFFIPKLLEELGFKVKFLGYKNLTYKGKYTLGDKIGELEVDLSTIFTATK